MQDMFDFVFDTVMNMNFDSGVAAKFWDMQFSKMESDKKKWITARKKANI